ncbi:hypothetical protein [Tenacibaculum piscium]|uniref:hypothetical protein n=1 Tax=Tenacibaculum piscium TaxID=1458515 RepID=UPI001F36CA4E|nr:hypothetical protein [Tenacibaculum piscium]MCG8183456.1 hypothetical protein [Tenacibaculum piscium]MCG8205057.1 hypothetical protein [Tenacibaculum piscium]
MKTIILFLAVLFLPCKDKNQDKFQEIYQERYQEKNQKELYKGTLNGSIKITLYINEQEHPCGGNLTILNAMYKYDNQKKWILLNITTDKQNKKYAMVEDNFSGALFLQKQNNSFYGTWISPNTKKQFKVILEKTILDETSSEKLEAILFDDLLYNKNDC